MEFYEPAIGLVSRPLNSPGAFWKSLRSGTNATSGVSIISRRHLGMQMTHFLGHTQQVASVNVTTVYNGMEYESPCPEWSACVRVCSRESGALTSFMWYNARGEPLSTVWVTSRNYLPPAPVSATLRIGGTTGGCLLSLFTDREESEYYSSLWIGIY